jgi:hypothetical protein
LTALRDVSIIVTEATTEESVMDELIRELEGLVEAARNMRSELEPASPDHRTCNTLGIAYLG